ncbi:cyclopropane-fatty-acyl-phospholipid synthase family protein [Bosea sp. (in: a-proteobacteria)]|uniref:SAM-dependent methyltransferase n=1 Tax=Bosea sp. (in: a-proteobacteria) TaxID=1871050 RepID=UPI0027364B32|nr:methyltransferase domain-containing protein [Bosea sp. (in: a-proteobacteria)]MDP3255778.1 methyltransferase domain-containing protein [Bosea sp. (in: a-proteobacteria)]
MKTFRTLAAACAVSLFALGAVPSQAQPAQAGKDAATTPAYVPQSGQAGKDVVWVPTQEALVQRMLDMAKVTKEDKLVDLGSGDGRTVIAAAKRGLTARGIEYNPDLVTLSKRSAEAEGVADRATFEQGDIFVSDFKEATVVTLFLLPELNLRLRPILLDMKPGTRVVSNTFTMDDWTPDETAVLAENCVNFCRAHFWVVPAKVGGTWRLGDGELSLTQKFQMLEGTLTRGGKALPITEARMQGSEISFMADGRRYTGTVTDGRMSGRSEGAGQAQDWQATRSAS